jgi:hypothetical protein
MISLTRSIFLFCIITAVSLFAARAQSPQIIVQAANAATPSPAKVVVTQDTSSLPAAIKLLEQLKAANEETLKRQEAALQQLDEIGKTAGQIKIFAHRD